MPELPDVEGFRRRFARHGLGKRVERVETVDRDLLRNTSPQGIGRALRGREFTEADRHGKWLIARTGGPLMLMHFGMTGLIHWTARDEPRHPHDRVVLHLEGGELRFRDQRKFGGVWLARDEAERERVTGPMGPDALDVDADALGDLLAGRRGALKPALMDQRLIAGMGNLLCDEVLWRARVGPRRPAGRLSPKTVRALAAELHEVLRASNRRGRIPPEEGWLTGVRDDRGARCPRCGTKLRRATIGGRTTVWCPRCQPR